MCLQKLKDHELEVSFHNVVRNELKIMHEVILHIQEVSRRKIFLAKAYGSLFQYLTGEMKYSAAAAQRRIEAAKLLSEVPAIAAKLESGELTLSHIGNVQSAIKLAEKTHQQKVGSEQKAELVNKVLNQNNCDTQQICAEALNIPVVKPQKITIQKDKSRRIEVTLTKEQFAKFERLKDLLAHKNLQKKHSQSMNDVLETIFDELLLKLKVNPRSPVSQTSNVSLTQSVSVSEMKHTELNDENASKVISDTEVKSARIENSAKWNSLTPNRKRFVREKDQCCQYEDPRTGKLCGNTFNLHVDHITPKRVGGCNDENNLRVLCRAHNLYREMGRADGVSPIDRNSLI